MVVLWFLVAFLLVFLRGASPVGSDDGDDDDVYCTVLPPVQNKWNDHRVVFAMLHMRYDKDRD